MWFDLSMGRKKLDRAIARYTAEYPETVARTDEFVAAVTGIIDDAGINYLSILGRAKTPHSYADKIARRAEALKTTEFDPLEQITDEVGIRVITYVQSDLESVAQLLAQHFAILEDRDMGQETAQEGRFGYASRHMLISRDPAATAYDPLQCASIQLRTVLQHAWAEFEHDARYKGVVPPEYAPELDRRFTLAAGLLELADREFSIIRDTLQSGLGEKVFDSSSTQIDPRDLASFLAGWYQDSGFSRADHYVWVAQLLNQLGITSIHDLRVQLQDVDSERVSRAMGYRYPAGAVRRLEDDLLDRYRDDYLALEGNSERVDTLRGRMARLGVARR